MKRGSFGCSGSTWGYNNQGNNNLDIEPPIRAVYGI